MTVSTYYLVTGLPNLSARQACPPFKFVCLLSWAQRFHSSDRHAFPSSARPVSPPISCADDEWKTAFRTRNWLIGSSLRTRAERISMPTNGLSPSQWDSSYANHISVPPTSSLKTWRPPAVASEAPVRNEGVGTKGGGWWWR